MTSTSGIGAAETVGRGFTELRAMAEETDEVALFSEANLDLQPPTLKARKPAATPTRVATVAADIFSTKVMRSFIANALPIAPNNRTFVW